MWRAEVEKVFITDIKVKNVRHLKDIHIPLSDNRIKHLILTGKNGSGKTSVLDIMEKVLDLLSSEEKIDTKAFLGILTGEIDDSYFDKDIEELREKIEIKINCSWKEFQSLYQQGKFVLAYYGAERVFEADVPKHVEKVELKQKYTMQERPRQNFVKYLLDLKMTEALAIAGRKEEKAQKIKQWFEDFQKLLQEIFEDKKLSLEFDEETFEFSIHENGREPFGFNALSSGYAAILDIVVDIMVRMEKQSNKVFQYDMPGIVLIDEVDVHLHLELQKKVLKVLTTVFQNVQFIVSTHSPFVLNSLENVVIYDLENHVLVEHGLSDVPYDGIVEGYFRVDKMSNLLKEKYVRYRELVQKSKLTDDDFEEIAKLEVFLNEIPDYLAFDITAEYQRLKLEFESREDIEW